MIFFMFVIDAMIQWSYNTVNKEITFFPDAIPATTDSIRHFLNIMVFGSCLVLRDMKSTHTIYIGPQKTGKERVRHHNTIS